MKIVILGSTGMLGRYVYSYLKQKFDVIELNRDKIDASFMSERTLQMLFQIHKVEKDDIVINCIGIIKQKKDISNLTYLRVNAEFPLILADVCEYEKIKAIHITTDCVFNGYDGYYTETSVHNAEDVYGKTKSLGEPNNCTVIRTSIIGEEKKVPKFSLIEWVKSNKDREINGYTNHKWNGITCLQFAKICEKIINENLYWKGVKHIFSPYTVTKDELVRMINDIYKLNIKINSIEAEIHCYRNLDTIYPKMFNISSILDQIKEQKEFYNSLV